MARTSNRRALKTTIFIACEGRNTEPTYFERIKEIVEEEGEISIEIYPDETIDNAKSEPLGLIGVAQENLKVYDEAYVVYDCDGYTKHQEAWRKAEKSINGKKVKIIFSNIAFEQWVLLHFECSLNSFSKSQQIIDYLQAKLYYPVYEKKITNDIYTFLKDRTSIAYENAAWLRYLQKEAINEKSLEFVKPYTNVDELVKRLLGDTSIICCGLLGEELSIETQFKIKVEIKEEEELLLIELFNGSDRVLIFNQNNIQQIISIRTINDINNQVHLFNHETVMIEPNEKEVVRLVLDDFSLVNFLYFNERRHLICINLKEEYKERV